MTNLGEAVAAKLRKQGMPIVSDIEIIKAMEAVYRDGKVRYLRGERPAYGAFERTRSILKAEKIIVRDADYSRFWRVNTVTDRAADEIVCLLDETVYISHLSAMQAYGLTHRRPTDLHLTRASDDYWRDLNDAKLQKTPEYAEFHLSLFRTHHPRTVRGRKLAILSTKRFGEHTQLRNSYARLSSAGMTFHDMLANPELCGGMSHVLEVFDEHSASFLQEIIREIDRTENQIVKVRAGYILNERNGVEDARVEAWAKFAQRGGSRVLDPKKPFSPQYSEKWMISLNV
jgi:predicted transcriptional regulator of viral defense system